MRLTINQISEIDEGDYYCHAENAFGSAVQPVSVRIRNVPASHNITQCCMDQNVSSSCMDACSFYLDIDAVIDKPECIADFDKLMKCAADGSGNAIKSTRITLILIFIVNVSFTIFRPSQLLCCMGCTTALFGLVSWRAIAHGTSLCTFTHKANSRLLP